MRHARQEEEIDVALQFFIGEISNMRGRDTRQKRICAVEECETCGLYILQKNMNAVSHFSTFKMPSLLSFVSTIVLSRKSPSLSLYILGIRRDEEGAGWQKK